MPLLDRLVRRGSAAPERKASRVGALVAAFSLGRPVWQERDFEKLAREGYRRNVIAYACIWLTAKAAADVPLVIRRRNGRPEEAGAATGAGAAALRASSTSPTRSRTASPSARPSSPTTCSAATPSSSASMSA